MCPDVLLIASMNGMYLGGLRNVGAYIEKMKRLGMRTGDLDLRLHWFDKLLKEGYGYNIGRTCYIELKSGRNTPTDQQLSVMADLDKIGIQNAWTNSIEGYVDILKRFGVPMRTGIYGNIRIT